MSLPAPTDTISNGSHLKAIGECSSDMADSEAMDQGQANKRTYDNDDNEDPATQAASENLKHASISEKINPASLGTSATLGEDSTAPDRIEEEAARPLTPGAGEPSDAQDEEMKERVSSPKKKRGREQDDEARDIESAGSVEEVGTSPNGGAVNGGRTTRLAPEKKRHRDASLDTVQAAETGVETKDPHVPDAPVPNAPGVIQPTTSVSDLSTISPKISSKPAFGGVNEEKAKTSASAFANSSFGSLAASSTSGFAALAASKPSVFGTGTAPQLSGFGALSGSSPVILDTSKAKLGFGSISPEPLGSTLSGRFGNTSTTGFGALGSGLGGGFGGFTSGSGPKLSSFAASGTLDILGGEKPAKAFGAPESDEENDSEDDDESRSAAASDEEDSISVDEKKKHRASRVPINDGEEGESTLLQLRAKLFAFSNKESGWKERGAGNLKLNVPRIYIDYDENGVPIPGSFDPSARDDSDEEAVEPGPISARLIMRQDHTHRVILNTLILKGLKFDEKSSSSGAVQILFTALEEAKPVNMLLRMNEANAKLFTSEIRSIQQEL